MAESLSYHFDLVSGAETQDSNLPALAESSRAVAEYLADMIGQLESMARVSGFELLVYLLSMARVEAEANAGDGRGSPKS
ncbi:MAG TPA: hypothetical protein VN715_13740 [Roseiarcus sp.]|nr:hypothetical protein [Roseiarcus sp.]